MRWDCWPILDVRVRFSILIPLILYTKINKIILFIFLFNLSRWFALNKVNRSNRWIDMIRVQIPISVGCHISHQKCFFHVFGRASVMDGSASDNASHCLRAVPHSDTHPRPSVSSIHRDRDFLGRLLQQAERFFHPILLPPPPRGDSSSWLAVPCVGRKRNDSSLTSAVPWIHTFL